MTTEQFNKQIKKYRYDRAAVEEIYNYYYPPIVKHINRCFHGKLEGQDIAQEFFIQLFDMNLPDYINFPTSWVYKVCYNIALKALKTEDKNKPLIKASEKLYIDEQSEELLNSLEPDCRDIVYLHYWERYKFVEIAALLNLNYSTVKARHRKAKKMLYKNIQKERKNEIKIK